MNNFVVYNAFFNKSPPPSQNRRLSASKQRQELTSWLLPSEKQRPYSEQYDINRSSRLRMLSEENDLFKNQRQMTRMSPLNDGRKPSSAFVTSYGHQQNPSSSVLKTIKPRDDIPRTYTNLFNENKYEYLTKIS